MIVDIWANWWPRDFFAQLPTMDRLYRRLHLDSRMRLTEDDVAAEAAVGGVSHIVISATAIPGIVRSVTTSSRQSLRARRSCSLGAHR